MKDLTEIVARALANRDPGRNYDTMTDWSQSYWREIADVALSALREAGALVEWKPVSEARTQDTYLVANEKLRGWVDVASLNALREWHVSDGQDRPRYIPTHWSPLPKPPVTPQKEYGQ